MATIDLECKTMLGWHRRGEIRIQIDGTLYIGTTIRETLLAKERMIDEVNSCFANNVADLSAVPR
jgi:hypothetical protein